MFDHLFSDQLVRDRQRELLDDAQVAHLARRARPHRRGAVRARVRTWLSRGDL
jgi:hypothetical protein